MGNLKNSPLYLTPQATRQLLGIGHARATAILPVEGKLVDQVPGTCNPPRHAVPKAEND